MAITQAWWEKGQLLFVAETRRPSAAVAARHCSMAGFVPAIGHAAAPIGISPCARTERERVLLLTLPI